MLEYEGWGNPSQMILTSSDDVVHQVHPDVDDHNANHHHHHHHGIDIFSTTTTDNNNNSNNVSGSVLSLDYTHHQTNANTFYNNNYHFFNNNNTSNNHIHHHHPLYDTRSFSSYNPFDNIANNSTPSSYFLVPKLEEGSSSIMSRQGGGGGGGEAAGTTRIGLNLGHRTYFSAQDDDFVNRLYRRSRPGGGGMDGVVGGGMVNSPRCQAEGCAADLSNAKHYHRRHKVCEFHSKAATVIAGGLTQRFCQQCSRFHLLTEFDNGKRSCRKRLADHNRRRRKTPQLPSPSSTSQSQLELQKSPVETLFNNLESPPESSAMTHLSSSSVTIAVSPPRMSLECFRQRSFREMASTSSSSSVFYSN